MRQNIKNNLIFFKISVQIKSDFSKVQIVKANSIVVIYRYRIFSRRMVMDIIVALLLGVDKIHQRSFIVLE